MLPDHEHLQKNSLVGDPGDPPGSETARVAILEEPTWAKGGPNRPLGQLMRGTEAATLTKCDTYASK